MDHGLFLMLFSPMQPSFPTTAMLWNLWLRSGSIHSMNVPGSGGSQRYYTNLVFNTVLGAYC